jgi:hypothetical protein
VLKPLQLRIDSDLKSRALFSKKLFVEVFMRTGRQRQRRLYMGYVTGTGLYQLHNVEAVPVADFIAVLHTRPESEDAVSHITLGIEVWNDKTGVTQTFPLQPQVVVNDLHKELSL